MSYRFDPSQPSGPVRFREVRRTVDELEMAGGATGPVEAEVVDLVAIWDSLQVVVGAEDEAVEHFQFPLFWPM
jgi:hypothetical protein